MANEICIAGTRGRKFDLVFLYVIPVEDRIDGVVPTPAAGVPATVTLEAVEITALDNGVAHWQRASFTDDTPEGMTDLEILAKIQEMYAEREAGYLAKYAAHYEHVARVGQRFDALVPEPE